MLPGPIRLSLASLAAACTLSVLAPPLAAQGLESPEAIETIIGSTVTEEQTQAATDPAKVIAAIEKTPQSIAEVRKTSSLDKVDIVFLTDSTVAEGGPPPEIEAKVKQHEPEITELRKEIEGNAMLFHAIDSRAVLIKDVLAVAFEPEAKAVVIYAAAKPGG